MKYDVKITDPVSYKKLLGIFLRGGGFRFMGYLLKCLKNNLSIDTMD